VSESTTSEAAADALGGEANFAAAMTEIGLVVAGIHSTESTKTESVGREARQAELKDYSQTSITPASSNSPRLVVG
jgi:predicted trehalose synthase